MYNRLKIGFGLFLIFFGQLTMAQSGSKLKSQPAGELKTLMDKADEFMTGGAYRNAYNTYLQLMNAYKYKNNQAGILENVDKIISLHQQQKITLPSNTLTYYYNTQQKARKTLKLKTAPKTYLNMAETYAKAGEMKQAMYFAEKGLRLSNNTETANLLNTFLRNLNVDRGPNTEGTYALKTKLEAVQKELLRKSNALGRLKRQNSLLRKQVISQAEEVEELDRGLKSQRAITKSHQRVNGQLEDSNNKRKWWNVALLFLALAGLVIGGYSAIKLHFNGKKGKGMKNELIQKDVSLLANESKLTDAESTIQSQTDELQDKKYTIQRHLSEIDGRKIELEELNEEAIIQQQQLDAIKASKVQFAETIAQDLKKPLNTILRSQDLVAIHRAGDQMKKYTEEMLAIQQYLNGHLDLKKADFNFHQMVQKAIEPWMAQADRKGVTVVNEVPSQYWGMFDKGLINRVTEKLFRNAIQHTLTGGKITISGKPVPENAGTAPITGLELTIADSGASIFIRRVSKNI